MVEPKVVLKAVVMESSTTLAFRFVALFLCISHFFLSLCSFINVIVIFSLKSSVHTYQNSVAISRRTILLQCFLLGLRGGKRLGKLLSTRGAPGMTRTTTSKSIWSLWL